MQEQGKGSGMHSRSKADDSSGTGNGSIGLILVLRDMSSVCEDAKGNRVWVKHVAKGSPADKESKIKIGDEITEIGQSNPIPVRKLAEGNHLDSIAKAISGRMGSKCFLRLYNYERKEEYTVTLERMDPASFGIEEKITNEEERPPSVVMLFLYPFERLSLLIFMCFIFIRLPNFLALLPETLKQLTYMMLQWTSPTVLLFSLVYLLQKVLRKRGSRTCGGFILLEISMCLFVFFSIVLLDYELLWRPADQATQTLRGRVAVVVNGYGGIELEVTRQLRDLGASIILGCQDEDSCLPTLHELASSSSSSRWAWTVDNMPLDFCSLRSIRSFGSQLSSKYGRIDYIVVGNRVSACKARENSESSTDVPNGFLRLYHLMDSLKPALLHSSGEATRLVVLSNPMQWLSSLRGRTGVQASMHQLLDDWIPRVMGDQPDDALGEMVFIREYIKQTKQDPSFRDRPFIAKAVDLGFAGTMLLAQLESMDVQMTRSSDGSEIVHQILRSLVLALRRSSLAANLVLYALFAPGLSSDSAGLIDAQGYEVTWHPGTSWRGIDLEQLASYWWKAAGSARDPS